MTTNDDWAIYSKSGERLFTIDFNRWFSTCEHYYDPKCGYDALAGRFVVLVLRALEGAETNPRWYSLMVSDDSDPRGVWLVYHFDATVNGSEALPQKPDYPYLGWDHDAIYIAAISGYLGGPHSPLKNPLPSA